MGCDTYLAEIERVSIRDMRHQAFKNTLANLNEVKDDEEEVQYYKSRLLRLTSYECELDELVAAYSEDCYLCSDGVKKELKESCPYRIYDYKYSTVYTAEDAIADVEFYYNRQRTFLFKSKKFLEHQFWKFKAWFNHVFKDCSISYTNTGFKYDTIEFYEGHDLDSIKAWIKDFFERHPNGVIYTA